MSHRALLEETVADIMSRHCPSEVVAGAEGSWSEPLWDRLAAAGLTTVGCCEELGGSGGDLADAATVARVVAAHAGPLPIAEALFPVAAGYTIVRCPIPDGPVTLATGRGLTLTRRSGRVVVDGSVRRVPYARFATRILMVGWAARPALAALVEPSRCKLTATDNLAGEPRDDLSVAELEVPDDQVTEVPPGTAEMLYRRAALGRAVQIAGALQAVLDLTVRYAQERVQFGRPIGRFQAVAHQIAALAGAATAASAAADAAVAAVCAGHDDGFAIAAAKVQASAAAGTAARIAHQVHGALGFTREYRLHHLTRRLWAWREEFGSEEYWAAKIGATTIHRGADELWPMIAGM